MHAITDPQADPDSKPDAEAPARADPIARLARLLTPESASTGRLSALRRFHPGTHGQHNLMEVQQVLAAADLLLPADDPRQAAWALVVHCLALARGAHQPQQSTGAALHDIGYSEARLRQLLEADGPMLGDLLPALARRLAASGKALDWRPLADLLLREGQAADTARRRIVQGFLQAERKASAKGKD